MSGIYCFGRVSIGFRVYVGFRVWGSYRCRVYAGSGFWGLIESMWGTVKMMVPFWVPIIIRGLIRGLI